MFPEDFWYDRNSFEKHLSGHESPSMVETGEKGEFLLNFVLYRYFLEKMGVKPHQVPHVYHKSHRNHQFLGLMLQIKLLRQTYSMHLHDQYSYRHDVGMNGERYNIPLCMKKPTDIILCTMNAQGKTGICKAGWTFNPTTKVSTLSTKTENNDRTYLGFEDISIRIGVTKQCSLFGGRTGNNGGTNRQLRLSIRPNCVK